MPYLMVVYVNDDTQPTDLDHTLDGRLVGVYELPRKSQTSVCPGFSGGCKSTTWTRHADGYMVHSCGRRRQGWRTRVAGAFLDTFGLNLLARERTPLMFQNPPSYEPTKKRAHSEE